jgi:hypothetical protein
MATPDVFCNIQVAFALVAEPVPKNERLLFIYHPPVEAVFWFAPFWNFIAEALVPPEFKALICQFPFGDNVAVELTVVPKFSEYEGVEVFAILTCPQLICGKKKSKNPTNKTLGFKREKLNGKMCSIIKKKKNLKKRFAGIKIRMPQFIFRRLKQI